jgi:hypothetical protein
MRLQHDHLVVVLDDDWGRRWRAGVVNAAGRFFDNAHIRS